VTFCNIALVINVGCVPTFVEYSYIFAGLLVRKLKLYIFVALSIFLVCRFDE